MLATSILSTKRALLEKRKKYGVYMACTPQGRTTLITEKERPFGMDWKTYEEIIAIRKKMRQEIEVVLKRTEEALEKINQKQHAKQLLYEI